MAEQDDFLSRWSRRKTEARAGLKKKEPAPAEEQAGLSETEAPRPGGDGAGVAPQRGELAAREGEGVVADAPAQEEDFTDFDFDALDYNSDYTRFMKKGVPDWVRQRALSKLWTSDPILANLDGLVDYGEDFTDAALAVKNLVTAWKPGQGYRTDEEVQRDREEYGPEDQKLAARKEREAREAAEARKAEAEESGEAGDGEEDETVASEMADADTTSADSNAAGAREADDTKNHPA